MFNYRHMQRRESFQRESPKCYPLPLSSINQIHSNLIKCNICFIFTNGTHIIHWKWMVKKYKQTNTDASQLSPLFLFCKRVDHMWIRNPAASLLCIIVPFFGMIMQLFLSFTRNGVFIPLQIIHGLANQAKIP